ncbi:MAG: hypothetical protein A6D92_18065 [Symbiobacterium thermophilum]|uniref:Uncharacterized protein n=1 Tax=Symbiobacterium thermophilum TaxID=2734 RepID=A0A1Y2T1Q3_SYMTR|nr:MAG: hypothetical protein A6D92_18065 [Symbiobacterium thermophilum]
MNAVRLYAGSMLDGNMFGKRPMTAAMTVRPTVSEPASRARACCPFSRYTRVSTSSTTARAGTTNRAGTLR